MTLAEALRLRNGIREAGPAEAIDVDVQESAGDPREAESGRELLILPEPEAEERRR